MRRFQVGDRVLVTESFGTPSQRPWPVAIVTSVVLGGLYDYAIQTAAGNRLYSRDYCLTPVEFTIKEDLEPADLLGV